LFGQYGLGNSREEKMAKPSRWTAEKRYQIVKEALSQKELIGQIARRHQVSEALIYRWREKFFDGGKAALAFEGQRGSGREKAALERQVEELQKLIGEQAVEIRFLKRLARS
jgi:transposase-like protein